MKVNSSRVRGGCYIAFFMTLSAVAQAPQPSAEFWQYLLEFSDEQGDVIDPIDFAQLESLPEKDDAERIATQTTNNSKSTSNNPSVENVLSKDVSTKDQSSADQLDSPAEESSK